MNTVPTQEPNTTTTPATVPANVIPASEKMFTQSEVNKIVSERLQREAQKYADYDEIKATAATAQTATEKANNLEAELNTMKAAEALRTMREKVSKETGVPSSLLTEDTEEKCTEQANAILAYAKPTYPTLRDGGELTHTIKPSTAKQFADWFNAEVK